MMAVTPALNFAPELLLRAQGVKVAFFDVDGVLTDGGLYFRSTRRVTSWPSPQAATAPPAKSSSASTPWTATA